MTVVKQIGREQAAGSADLRTSAPVNERVEDRQQPASSQMEAARISLQRNKEALALLSKA